MGIDINNYLRINPVDMILVCASTLLLVLVAKRFFWDVVVKFFDARQKFIQDEIEAGQQARKEGEAFKQQYETQMKEAKSEASQLVEQARLQAEANRKEVLNKTNEEVKQMKAKAFADIEMEKQKAQQELANTVSELAFEAASNIIQKEIDPSMHEDYMNDFLRKAGEESWQA